MSSYQSTKDESDKVFKAYKDKIKKKTPEPHYSEDYMNLIFKEKEKDFYHKQEEVKKTQEYQNKLNLKKLYEKKSIINIYGLSCRGHFKTLSKLLRDHKKINNLQLMNPDKCCVIDYNNGYSLDIINKDGALHIRASNDNNVANILYRIVDVSIHGQLYIIGNIFGANDSVSKIDEILAMPTDRCMTYSNQLVPKNVHARLIDNEIIFSGISF